MGNSDSKQLKGTSNISLTSAQAYRNGLHSFLEREFEKRADSASKQLSRDGFQACLRAVQEQYDLKSIASSPLGIGLFELSAKERPGNRPVLSISEYASAMAVIFNNMEQPVLSSMTTQAILKWYQFANTLPNMPTAITDDIVVAFFDATWRFAWSELSRRILSNVCLNGKGEAEAIGRFSEAGAKFFDSHASELNTVETSLLDNTISVSIGDEEVLAPTSFSFIAKSNQRGSDFPTGTNKRAVVAYPEL